MNTIVETVADQTPEADKWMETVDVVYDSLKRHLQRTDYLNLDANVRDAVVLDQFIGQIYNGGIHQWTCNGYGKHFEFLVHALSKIESESSKKALEFAKKALKTQGEWGEDDVDFEDFEELQEEMDGCEAIETLEKECREYFNKVL